MTKVRLWGRRTALLMTLAAAVSCGALRRPLRLRVHVAPRANQDRPVAVDLVAARDKRLGDVLAKTPAAEWFAKREQFQRDYPRAGALEVRSWEWVPGQVVDELEIPLAAPKAVFVFARYASGGEHRARIENAGVSTLILGERELKVETEGKGKKQWLKR